MTPVLTPDARNRSQRASFYHAPGQWQARQALIGAKLVRVTPEVYMTMQDYYRDPTMRPSVEALEQTQQAMIKAGFQKKRADVRAMVDLSYLPN